MRLIAESTDHSDLSVVEHFGLRQEGLQQTFNTYQFAVDLAMRRAEYLRVVQPVISYFEKKGLPVIAKRDTRNGDILRGKDEFGVSLEESEFSRPDVLAFNWRSDPLITTEAVECKLANSSGKSVEGALGQAASYQILFDHVYVAVQSGEIGYRESILSELGLGWISVDKSGDVDIRRLPEHRRRFDMDQFNKQVLPRLVLPLAFLEVFGRPIGYGETREGGIWVAKELARDPDMHLQVSSWFDRSEQASYIGLNIEYKETLRAILRQDPDLEKLSRMLKELDSSGYEICLTKDPNPKPRNAKDIPIKLEDKTDTKEVFNKIANLLSCLLYTSDAADE